MFHELCVAVFNLHTSVGRVLPSAPSCVYVFSLLYMCVFLCLSLSLFVCLSLSLCLSMCLSVSPSLYLSICLSVCFSLSLSLSIYLSIYLSLSVCVCFVTQLPLPTGSKSESEFCVFCALVKHITHTLRSDKKASAPREFANNLNRESSSLSLSLSLLPNASPCADIMSNYSRGQEDAHNSFVLL